MEAVAKQRRSVVKRQKKEADKLAKKTGPLKVELNDVPTSDRKMRLVADLIRGKEVTHALGILKFQPKVGAARLEKLLVSAMANWEATRGKIDESEIFVKEIFVDGGRILKRLRPAPQGRAHRVRKRSNHVTLVIDSAQTELSNFLETAANTAAVETAPVQEAKTKTAKEPKTPKAKSKNNDNK